MKITRDQLKQMFASLGFDDEYDYTAEISQLADLLNAHFAVPLCDRITSLESKKKHKE